MLASSRFAVLILFGAFVSACGPGQGGAPTDGTSGLDLSVALFAPDHLIEVDVEIDESEWSTLCLDGRTATDVFSGCAEGFEYENFRATVTVDGERYRDVAIHKKGFLGSLSVVRPSLKLNFGTFVEGRTHAGMKRMTLNNNRQDPSNTHQCMAYELFRKAGVVASRCNFAHVVVNGVDLGIYTHVESVKKPMLRRHFADDDGNLYEGQGSDFTVFGIDQMELKTNEAENDRRDLTEVVRALEADDENLLEALDEVLDVDGFLNFWSMEVITGHWDGYAGNRNNYLAYHDPTSGQFSFVPWGTDGSFQRIQIFNAANTNVAVLAESAIANRLYEHPEGRALYLSRLRELFDRLWDEEELIAETDRIGLLTNAAAAAIETQRNFIREQGIQLRAELDREAADFPEWIRGSIGLGAPECRAEARTHITGEFTASWGGAPGPGSGSEFEMVLNGEPLAPKVQLILAGDALQGAGYQVTFLSPWKNGRLLAVVLSFPEELFAEGVIAMHGLETGVLVALVNPAQPDQIELIGFGGKGTITLDAISTTDGEVIRGSFESDFIQIAGFDS
jgi:hypothetical protein